jgi:hypothetical protein
VLPRRFAIEWQATIDAGSMSAITTIAPSYQCLAECDHPGGDLIAEA